jgi:hypothetical protein
MNSSYTKPNESVCLCVGCCCCSAHCDEGAAVAAAAAQAVEGPPLSCGLKEEEEEEEEEYVMGHLSRDSGSLNLGRLPGGETLLLPLLKKVAK